MNKIYDISLTISPELPVWPGDPRVQFERVSKLEDGEIANVTRLNTSAHVGTHVDAPCHFLANGHTVEQLSLDILTGSAVVIELPDVAQISAEDLKDAGIPPGTKRLLIKTRNSQGWAQGIKDFNADYVAVAADAAQYIVDQGIELVGVDYLSVAPYHALVKTHEILLKKDVIIVEGLNLSEISPGEYTLYCLPLKLAGADGAPARAILIQTFES